MLSLKKYIDVSGSWKTKMTANLTIFITNHIEKLF